MYKVKPTFPLEIIYKYSFDNLYNVKFVFYLKLYFKQSLKFLCKIEFILCDFTLNFYVIFFLIPWKYDLQIVSFFFFAKSSTIPQIENLIINKAKLIPLILMSLCIKPNYLLVWNLNFKQSIELNFSFFLQTKPYFETKILN